MDTDSRNPSVEHAFGFRPAVGLSELLRGEELKHDPDRATEYENLYVLGPGLHSGDLIERMGSREMREFLEGAAELFDHIIVDSPASLLMAETRFLAALVDGVVVVAGAGVSSFGMLRRCLDSVEETGARILGIVVNGVRPSPGGYLRQNLDQYYSEESHRQGGDSVPLRRARSMAEPSILIAGDETAGREKG